MRKWYKYIINKSSKDIELALDNSELEHTIALSKIDVINVYKSKTSFFNNYYYNFHQGRLESYEDFLLTNLNKKHKILSVASGRSANELRLIDIGYNIHCSDLYQFIWFDETVRLWPNYKFSVLDITKNHSKIKYDTILVLSLIFIFNNTSLDNFFKNIYKSLDNNGYLILDSAGSTDNYLTFFIHDVLLRFEIVLIKLFKNLKGFNNNYSITKIHHGYRRTNDEIIYHAKKNGFELIKNKNYSFNTEFSRGYILPFLIKKIPLIKYLLRPISKKIPYVRMFTFKKVKIS